MAWFGGTQAGKKAKLAAHSKRRSEREKAAHVEGAESFTLDDVYARDNGYCYLCSLPVIRKRASMEHVVALANGGLHTLENVRLAHKRCNSKKGARSGPRKKGLRRTGFKPKSRPALPTHDDDGSEIF